MPPGRGSLNPPPPHTDGLAATGPVLRRSRLPDELHEPVLAHRERRIRHQAIGQHRRREHEHGDLDAPASPSDGGAKPGSKYPGFPRFCTVSRWTKVARTVRRRRPGLCRSGTSRTARGCRRAVCTGCPSVRRLGGRRVQREDRGGARRGRHATPAPGLARDERPGVGPRLAEVVGEAALHELHGLVLGNERLEVAGPPTPGGSAGSASSP